jgi:hypothetical protein
MNQEQATALVKSELDKRETCSAQLLSDRTGVSILQVYKVLKVLVDSGVAQLHLIDDIKHYSISSKVVKLQAEPETKTTKLVTKPIGRDTTKFVINKQKQAYSKGQCAYQVVRMHIEKTNPTLEQLRLDFPDKIVGRFGVVNTLKEAQVLSPDRPRYNMKEHQVMTTSDGASVVVTNQWTVERFNLFIIASKQLGIDIRPE